MQSILTITKKGVVKGDTITIDGNTLEFPCTMINENAKLARHLVAIFAKEHGFEAKVRYTKVIITKQSS
jgi:hypothetical protein